MDTNQLPFRFLNMEQLLAKTAFVVEATNFEKQALWKDYSPRMKWGETQGWLQQVAKILDHPVTISIFFQELDGHVVLFYHATSRIVDHDAVRHWLNTNVPVMANKDARSHIDAQNFHICMHALAALPKPELLQAA